MNGFLAGAVLFDQEPRPEGRNYVEQAQPDKKPSSGPRENEQQR